MRNCDEITFKLISRNTTILLFISLDVLHWNMFQRESCKKISNQFILPMTLTLMVPEEVPRLFSRVMV